MYMKASSQKEEIHVLSFPPIKYETENNMSE